MLQSCAYHVTFPEMLSLAGIPRRWFHLVVPMASVHGLLGANEFRNFVNLKSLFPEFCLEF
jgi:hypothetical protein